MCSSWRNFLLQAHHLWEQVGVTNLTSSNRFPPATIACCHVYSVAWSLLNFSTLWVLRWLSLLAAKLVAPQGDRHASTCAEHAWFNFFFNLVPRPVLAMPFCCVLCKRQGRSHCVLTPLFSSTVHTVRTQNEELMTYLLDTPCSLHGTRSWQSRAATWTR